LPLVVVATGERCSHGARAFFNIEWRLVALRGTTHRDRVGTGHITIARTVISPVSAVTGRPYVNHSLSITTLPEKQNEHYSFSLTDNIDLHKVT